MPKVLIADDSMFQRFALAKTVRGLGYDVIEAKNGQECLDAVAQSTPDMILLDLNMPVLNGFEVLEALQNQKATIPVVVVSADIQESSRERCLKLGARAVLGKPFQDHKLAALLSELTGTPPGA
ncbi:response regulator [Desulfonatronum thioautotrophicum]|uniref:response regulator n=1 Tax=Desulfonatronum thioautotrophicum TaxID=617001 RepID=UPI0005EAFE2C|nr:response regulator [Desulfonatronum thioautotrophicum]